MQIDFWGMDYGVVRNFTVVLPPTSAATPEEAYAEVLQAFAADEEAKSHFVDWNYNGPACRLVDVPATVVTGVLHALVVAGSSKVSGYKTEDKVKAEQQYARGLMSADDFVARIYMQVLRSQAEQIVAGNWEIPACLVHEKAEGTILSLRQLGEVLCQLTSWRHELQDELRNKSEEEVPSNLVAMWNATEAQTNFFLPEGGEILADSVRLSEDAEGEYRRCRDIVWVEDSSSEAVENAVARLVVTGEKNPNLKDWAKGLELKFDSLSAAMGIHACYSLGVPSWVSGGWNWEYGCQEDVEVANFLSLEEARAAWERYKSQVEEYLANAAQKPLYPKKS